VTLATFARSSYAPGVRSKISSCGNVAGLGTDRWLALGNNDQGTDQIGTKLMFLSATGITRRGWQEDETHLGTASTKSLRIIDLPPPAPLVRSCTESSIDKDGSTSISTQDPFILQLPDQLLLPKIEFSASDHVSQTKPRFTMTYSNVAVMMLSRVYRRLRHLV
jgi:hypothetical protein